MGGSECTRRFVWPLGEIRRPYVVTVQCADRQPRLVMANRYPKQIIGLALRLPDGRRIDGVTTHHSLSFVWATPARWWK